MRSTSPILVAAQMTIRMNYSFFIKKLKRQSDYVIRWTLLQFRCSVFLDTWAQQIGL
jgi:hypothetical protein